MAVDRTDRHHGFRGQPQFFRPFCRELSNGRIGSISFRIKIPADRYKQGIHCGKKFFRRQSAPFSMPEGFMSGGTTAWFHRRARQLRRDPVTMFHKGMDRTTDFRINPQDVQQLAPEPFRRTASAAVLGIIGEIAPLADFIDPLGFGKGGVIFPEQEHGIRIFRELRQQCQRRSIRIHSAGSTAGTIHPDPGDKSRLDPAFCQNRADRIFHAFQIIQRMLAEHADGWIRESAFLPAGVRMHCRCHHIAGTADKHCTDAVRTEIKSDQVLFCHSAPHFPKDLKALISFSFVSGGKAS